MPKKRKVRSDKLKCQICGERFGALAGHIVAKHDISTEEYKKRYGVKFLLSKSGREKLSKSVTQKRSRDKYIPRTHRQILIDLKKLAAQKPFVNTADLLRRAPRLYYQVQNHIGKVADVFKELGYATEGRTTWSNAKVLKEIKRRNTARTPEGNGLYLAAKRRFGSWKAAVEAAGLKYDIVRVDRKQAERLARKWSRRHGALSYAKLNVTDPSLRHVLHNKYGGIEAAAKALNLPFEMAYEKWTRQRIISEIKAIDAKGLSVRAGNVDRGFRTLYKRALGEFKSWKRVLKACGIDPKLHTYERELEEKKDAALQALDAELKAWVKHNGALCRSSIQETDPRLMRSVSALHGNLLAAAQATGLPYINRAIERADARREKKLQDRNDPSRATATDADGHLVYIQCELCKQWHKRLPSHLSRHGISADEYKAKFKVESLVSDSIRAIQKKSVKARPHKWTREKIVAELKRMGRARPELVGKKARQKTGLYGALLRTFGSLNDAILAAGLSTEPDAETERMRLGKRLNAWVKKHGFVHGESMRRQDANLYRHACKYFDSLPDAAAYFKLPYKRHKNEWTQERVLDAIRLRHAKDLPLGSGTVSKREPGMVSAGQRLFGTWKTTVEAAGISYDRYERPATRSDEDFRVLLQTWIDNHGPLEWKKLNTTDHKLRVAIEGRFKSVERAARQLGFPFRSVYQRWTKQRVLEELNARKKNGLPMQVNQIHRSDTKLYKAAFRYFGTVGTALKAADFDSGSRGKEKSDATFDKRRVTPKALVIPVMEKKSVRPKHRRKSKRQLDEDYITCLVCQEQLKTISASHLRTHGLTTEDYKLRFGVDTVFSVASRRTNSEIKRKINLEIPFEPLDRNEVIARLIEYDKEQSPLSSDELYSRDPSLLNQARRIFGEWSAILDAAGLARRESIVRSKAEVAKALRNFSKKHGKLSYSLLKEKDSTLCGQVEWRYGSLSKAADLLKLPFSELYQSRTKESVLADIQERSRQGGNLGMGASSTEDGALVVAACRRFGTWEAAVETAGFDYASIRTTRSWSNEAVIKEIKQRHANGRSLQGVRLTEEGNMSLLGAGLKRFGSWSNAVEAAGIDYELVTGRIRWTREKFLELLRERNKAGDSLDYLTVCQEDGRLAQATYRYFGSWMDGLLAAGIKVQIKQYPSKEKVSQKKKDPAKQGVVRVKSPAWTEEQLIVAIKAIAELHGGLSYKKIQAADSRLARAIGKHYGGVQKAAKELGLKWIQPKINNKWTVELVIKALQTRNEKSQSLTKTIVMRENWGLHNGALKHFSTWSAAIKAAGIDPEPWCNTSSWTVQLVEKGLRNWVSVHGALNRKQLSESEPSLVNASCRFFGGLKKAADKFGLPFRLPTKSWNPKLVLSEIRKVKKETGHLIAHRFKKDGRSDLVRAGMRYFGSWCNAVEAAGFDFADERGKMPNYTKEDVATGLREWVTHNGPLFASRIARANSGLAAATYKFYGSMIDAAQKLGLPYREKPTQKPSVDRD